MPGLMEMKLEGAEALERKLKKLPDKVGKKIVRTNVRKAGKVILAAAKSKARQNVGGRMGGLIAKFLVLRNQKKQRKGSFGMSVFISEKGNPQFVHITQTGVQHYIPAAIEHGHGRNKAQAARPYFRPAFFQNQHKAEKVLLKGLRIDIEAEAAKPG